MFLYNCSISSFKLFIFVNSKLISFWFIVRFAKLQRDLFPQFKKHELEKFPIPNSLDKKKENNLITLVDLEQKNPKDSKLSDQIDFLVYDLFSISVEEKIYIENYLNKFD